MKKVQAEYPYDNYYLYVVHHIGINYMNQATRQWDAIMQTVKENCSADYTGFNPNDDLEKMFHERKVFDYV